MADVKNDLQALLSDITLTSDRLLSTPKAVDLPSSKNPTPPSPTRKPRVSLTKITSKFLQGRRQKTPKGSIKLPSNPSDVTLPFEGSPPSVLENGSGVRTPTNRRESDASDRTLVDRPQTSFDGGISSLLNHLAPLISALQKLTPRITALPHVEFRSVVILYQNACEELVSFLTTLNKGCKALDGEDKDHRKICDEHDLEMRSLLLSALVRKVQTEASVVKSQRESYLNTDVTKHDILIHDTSRSQSQTQPSPSVRTIRSPLLPNPTANPFILHSSAISSPPLLRPSPAISVPISHPRPIARRPTPQKQLETAIDVQPSLSFQSFVTASQMSSLGLLGVGGDSIRHGQMGIRDVFRLENFQNSLLFSPSPVAVRRSLLANRVETTG